MPDLHSAEEVFYSRYDWCLNPILSVQELLHRFAEEINDYPAFGGWQREECQINLYLFACAAKTVAEMEDAFARGVSRARLYTPRCDRAHPTLLRIFYNQGQTHRHRRPADRRGLFCSTHGALSQAVELVACRVVQHSA